ncbi:hypothetical protein [Chitinophaga nivalis]|uniref:PH domain-containing protein n=1 Tax=Chitinophaga nivalis TaxID=2991709 RepID=A0ABT3IIV8_9BACT|nr:hypothetical protein [Chitinophaga nivalis]MCW3466413.1 hypothetical protein [Chitinophaga nivalis]MCW3483896.1 hypothetical protein [Chitinophaga nivalis]
MQSFKYFTREGNVYIKKNQTVLYYGLAILLFALMAFVLLSKNNPGAKASSILLGLAGVVLLLRTTGKLRIDATTHTISMQPVFFMRPNEFRFEDFRNFVISRQTFIITMNATATMELEKHGKRKVIFLHQTMFVTKPLQQVTDELATIMGIEN